MPHIPLLDGVPGILGPMLVGRYRAMNRLTEETVVLGRYVSGYQFPFGWAQRIGLAQQHFGKLIQRFGCFRTKHGHRRIKISIDSKLRAYQPKVTSVPPKH